MTAPTAVAVTGGSAGIAASIDDLVGLASTLHLTAGSVQEVLDDVTCPVVYFAAETGAEVDLVGSVVLRAEVDDVAGRLRSAAGDVDELGLRVARAAAAYVGVDDSVLDELGAITSGAVGVVGVVGDLFGGGAGGLDLYRSLPALTAALAWATTPLAELVARADPDGRAVVRDLGADPRARTAPRALDELIDDLTLRDEGRHGEISVSFVVGADGRRRAIVDIPGTKSWNPLPNHDVTSVGTDVRAVSGLRTSYEDGVLEAMAAAGVRTDEDVMLVGHSEGGIVAVDAARDAVRAGRFRVTHVVTAGSPIGRVAGDLPPSVRVLALENRADVVPATDGATNPDRRNVVTATAERERWSVVGNHDLEQSYRPIAVAVEHSCDESVDDFLGSAQHFLDGAAMRTHAYVITRG